MYKKEAGEMIKGVLVFCQDVLCMFMSLWLGLWLEGIHSADRNTMRIMFFLLLTAVAAFRMSGSNGNNIREFDTISAVKLCLTVALVFAMLAVYTMIGLVTAPMMAYFNAFVYSCALTGGYRLFLSAGNKLKLRLALKTNGRRKRVLIVGAGDAGCFLANLLNFDASKGRSAVAFIDDNRRLWGKNIKGLPVFGGRELIPHAAREYKIDEIIIAIPHVDNSTIREIFKYCCQAECPVRRFGNLSDFTAKGLEKATLDDVKVEDLLGRDSVKLDLERVRGLLCQKVVMVTGGAGSIGSEICRQVMKFNPKRLLIFDINENGLFDIQNELNQEHKGHFETILGSIRDQGRLEEVFAHYRPEVVFHAAAHKHVPMMEYNPTEAIKNNIFGSLNVMKTAVDYKAENFILISSDKAVNPTNIMGATKRVTELIANLMSKKNGTVFATVRFGNVLGSNGSVISVFKKQIGQGRPVTVTDRNIERYFMTIPEAAQLVLEAASIAKGGELFVLDMGAPVKIYDLAVNMIHLSGLIPEKDIPIEITGLRPGEKMFEELRFKSEEVTKTSNDHIFVIKMNEIDEKVLQTQLEAMKKSIEKRESLEILMSEVKQLVPTFERERLGA